METINIDEIRKAASDRSIYYESDTYCDFMAGAEFVIEKYEEKLRWIPIDEIFPEIKPFFLKNENKHEGDTHYIEYVGQYDIIHPDDIRKRTHWRSAFL